MGKKKIVRPARLLVCPRCKSHGKIVYSDGSESKELYTHEEAKAEVLRAIKVGLLLLIEVVPLMEQINAHIPTREDLALEEQRALELLPLALADLLEQHLSEDEPANEHPAPRRIPLCDN